MNLDFQYNKDKIGFLQFKSDQICLKEESSLRDLIKKKDSQLKVNQMHQKSVLKNSKSICIDNKSPLITKGNPLSRALNPLAYEILSPLPLEKP